MPTDQKAQPYVIYHANCQDGFGAAWAAHHQLGDSAVYLPASYGDPPPNAPSESELFILDFSYPVDVMKQLHARHNGRVTLIDHHATAQAELQGVVPNCHFNSEHSGAVLAWQWWAPPDQEVPLLLRYIQDRDLWRWELPRSREVAAALDSYPKDFYLWDTLSAETLILDGQAILRRDQLMVGKLLQQTVWQTVARYRIPAVNTPVLVSETCEALLDKYPKAPFAAAYSDIPGYGHRQRWSLRSRPPFDVSQIAQQMGGGGHPQAAGFTLQKLGTGK